MEGKKASKILKRIGTLLDKEDICFWLDSGTLLGAVRDGKIIEGDNDIDLGSWSDNYNEVKKALHQLPSDYLVIYSKHIHIYYEDIRIDITLYDKKDDTATTFWKVNDYYVGPMINYIRHLVEDKRSAKFIKIRYPFFLTNAMGHFFSKFSPEIRRKMIKSLNKIHDMLSSKIFISIPAKYFNELSTIQFYGIKFNIPSPVEEYLEYRYGKDWKTPKKDYIYYKDDESIID